MIALIGDLNVAESHNGKQQYYLAQISGGLYRFFCLGGGSLLYSASTYYSDHEIDKATEIIDLQLISTYFQGVTVES